MQTPTQGPRTPQAPRPSRARLALFAALTTALFFTLASALLAALERRGLVSTHSQDASVTYLQGTYLNLDPDAEPPRYRIMDPQRPDVVQTSFPAAKAKGVVRVILTGGSFVRGGHHLPPATAPSGYGTISDWLQWVLEARYPSTRFEIVNAGANGQSSVRVLAVAEELLHADPDALIIATGNNEGSRPVSGLNQDLNQWNLYRLLRRTVKGDPNPGQRPEFPIQQLGGERLTELLRQNLEGIIASANQQGRQLVLATLPLNLRSSFGMEADQGALSAACLTLRAATDSGSCDAALDALPACEHSAKAAGWAARCLERTGDLEAARAMYKLSIQIEPGGRARPSYNEAVRALAAEHGLPLVDLEAGMEARASNGIPGGDPFIDQVHLTCMGYLPVARQMADTLAAAGVIPVGRGEPLPQPTAAQLLADHAWALEADLKRAPNMRRDHAMRVCGPDPTYPF